MSDEPRDPNEPRDSVIVLPPPKVDNEVAARLGLPAAGAPPHPFWAGVMQFCSRIWPHSVAELADVDANNAIWAVLSPHFTEADITVALEAMIHSPDITGLPRLAQWRSACTEARRVRLKREEDEARQTAAAVATRPQTYDGRLAAFERGVAEQAEHQRVEAIAYAKEHGSTPEELTATVARINTAGPFERRMHAVVAGETKPGEGLDEFWQEVGRSSRGNLASTMAEVAGEVSPPPTLEQQADDLARLWLEDKTSVDPAALGNDLRDAMREAVKRRMAETGATPT